MMVINSAPQPWETRTEAVNGISKDKSISGSVNHLRLSSFLRPGCWLSLDQIFIFNDPENLKYFPLRS